MPSSESQRTGEAEMMETWLAIVVVGTLCYYAESYLNPPQPEWSPGPPPEGWVKAPKGGLYLEAVQKYFCFVTVGSGSIRLSITTRRGAGRLLERNFLSWSAVECAIREKVGPWA